MQEIAGSNSTGSIVIYFLNLILDEFRPTVYNNFIRDNPGFFATGAIETLDNKGI